MPYVSNKCIRKVKRMSKKEQIKEIVQQSYKKLPVNDAIPDLIWERRCENALRDKYNKKPGKGEEEAKDFVRRSYMDPPYMGYTPSTKKQTKKQTKKDNNTDSDEKTL